LGIAFLPDTTLGKSLTTGSRLNMLRDNDPRASQTFRNVLVEDISVLNADLRTMVNVREVTKDDKVSYSPRCEEGAAHAVVNDIRVDHPAQGQLGAFAMRDFKTGAVSMPYHGKISETGMSRSGYDNYRSKFGTVVPDSGVDHLTPALASANFDKRVRLPHVVVTELSPSGKLEWELVARAPAREIIMCSKKTHVLVPGGCSPILIDCKPGLPGHTGSRQCIAGRVNDLCAALGLCVPSLSKHTL
jgi:hypothetical protein